MKYFRILLILLLSLTLTGCLKKNTSTQPEPEPKPKDIPVSELPYATLIPHADGHRLDIAITGIRSPRMDYQIIYTGHVNGNPVERGFGGRDIKLNGSTELLRNGEQAVVFGSASSGKFKYDEGVTSGSLELVYRNDKGKSTGMAVTQWKLFDSSKETLFSSPDSKLQFTVTTKAKTQTMFVLMHTLGLPAPATGTPLMGPYAILTSSKSPVAGKLTLTLPSPSPAKLYSYSTTSKSWQEVKSVQSDTTLTSSLSAPSVLLVTQ